MTTAPVILFSGSPEKRSLYEPALTKAAADAGLALDLHMAREEVAPGDVDYIIYDGLGPVQDFAPFTKLKGVVNLWAGVEAVLRCNPPVDLPIARMVEEGLSEGMRDYVVGHVLRHHINADMYIDGEPIAEWELTFPPLARDRTVGVLGIGVLGADCAHHLSYHGFRTLGWSRSQKSVEGVTCLSGPEGLDQIIRESEILVLLLPNTPDTKRILNAERIAAMPKGAYIVNAGRGSLIDHDALLAALDSGHIAHATMDVFDKEPLPADHPYWHHPRATVTPHIASVTRPETASQAIMKQIARAESGLSFENTVDRTLGY
ncbi:glyoxylate/hydroxypyruvate reductase A [Rhodobacteraceae bacterium NNCM2]|nr:glyoxylate/hydroxypyruvate reductase A [Coraliihabitans acroporae]